MFTQVASQVYVDALHAPRGAGGGSAVPGHFTPTYAAHLVADWLADAASAYLYCMTWVQDGQLFGGAPS